MSGEGKVVCVTGASGFIASWLVKLLLDRGYTVKATVRNLKVVPKTLIQTGAYCADDPTKVAHLLALDGAKERLRLFEAELLKQHCFDLVIQGCDGVFHTASPVTLTATSKEELVDPAVKGTLNVLQSCAKSPSVKRVVMTSSMAAVMHNRNHLAPDVVADETWFSDTLICEETKQWYPLSKTLAEEAAWKFARDNGIDLVTICPGYVIGPILQPTLNFTTECLLNLIKQGKEVWPSGIYRFVDVRDVADAHIRAFEVPSANGRYCAVGITTYSSVALSILHKHYPSMLDKCNAELPVVAPYQVSKEKVKSIGVNFTSLELSLKDTIESLKEKNLLQT